MPHAGKQIVALIPWRHAVTGGVQADHRIVEELTSRGWTVETVYFGEAPPIARNLWWWHCIKFNCVLLRKYWASPPGTVFLADQGLSIAFLLFSWYIQRRKRARLALLAYHLVFNLWRNPMRRALWRWTEGATARQADLVIASSESARHELLTLGVSPMRVQVVPLGISRRASREEARRIWHDGPVRLLSIGTVEPRKGLEYLVLALADLRDCNWRLDVAGTVQSNYHGHLVDLARSAGLLDRIEFHGRVSDDDIDVLLSRADIFVSPSLWEGFGLAVLEAMDRGLPVVASRAGALSELIDHEYTGLLVPPADVPALAQALRRLIQDRDLRCTLGSAATVAVRERYSWAETGRQIDAALACL